MSTDFNRTERTERTDRTERAERTILADALVVALGAGIALGLARFAYALVLPPMRAALDWNYFTAGAMNTANAAGYLAGALAAPWLLGRFGARAALAGGSAAASVMLALHGAVSADAALYALRFLSGCASAAIFVAGGLIAARLASEGRAGRAGLVLGIYYGGTGVGIVASALALPPLLAQSDGWRAAWLTLGLLALAATVTIALRSGLRAGQSAASHAHTRAPLGRFTFGLAAYLLFGLGYIGYMTFIVTLLREQRMSGITTTFFFALLGLAVIVSPWLWASLLQRHRGGRALGTLIALLAVATAIPVVVAYAWAAFISGALFGSVLLSVVASTTALVRHNLPESAWTAGVGAFTIVFAFGQIVGPSLVGYVADGPWGLRGGFAISALILALGAGLAFLQRPLAR